VRPSTDEPWCCRLAALRFAGGVVARRALDEREVHSRPPGVEELAEVGVVGQEPVGLDQRGVPDRV